MPLQLSEFESYPSFIYGAHQPQTGSGNFMDFFRGNFGNVYQDYMGGLGRTVRQGGDPTQSFTQFMGGYNPWSEFQKQTPQQRGEQQGQYAPSMYFNLPRV